MTSPDINLPIWLVAALWGLVGGSSLLIGAIIGYYLPLRQKFVAMIMAFGSGVLLSALCLELMDKAFKRGGPIPVSCGFIFGSLTYSVANLFLERRVARERKYLKQSPIEKHKASSGTAIAIGALLDGIPESIVIGLSMIYNLRVSLVTVIAIFISNFPEGLASAAAMKKNDRSAKYVFSIWIGLCFSSGIASAMGYSIVGQYSASAISAVISFAAGAMLAMLADTMIPEAFTNAKNWSATFMTVGFLVSFLLSKLISEKV